ncbi:hypothetical protein HT585_10985 [Ensifer sp. HO-A22]|uniref:Uncharacterized protein n=1 Tax=Ensifer oleiphilus TaxID=2742698 RepID=A0A7Y6Q5C9_9HYPH|nr:hypothetical protein [Ensifer oleiphilus]NVD39383.1 hypothetical protein [Ensifer oleiphilus]
MTQQVILAIAQAIGAGKARAIRERASPQEVDELGLLPSDCHSNAEKFASARGGRVVRGWLAGRNFFIPHSVVDLHGVLHEATPVDNALYDACVFVAEKDVPAVDWSKEPPVLFCE